MRQTVAPSMDEAARGGRAGPEVYARGWKAAGAALVDHVTSLWPDLLPSACLICEQVQREVVCTACADALLRPVPRCPRCAMPDSVGLCGTCADDDPIDATLTLGDYAAPFDRLILRLKFGARLPAAGWIAVQLASQLRATPLPDLLLPIPLSSHRLAERGFNQAWEITRPLARQLGIASSATQLVRDRDTPSQRVLDLASRHANLRDAFGLSDAGAVSGTHVGLIDDVMTTGATLREAARVLKAHGAARVTAIAALRTP